MVVPGSDVVERNSGVRVQQGIQEPERAPSGNEQSVVDQRDDASERRA